MEGQISLHCSDLYEILRVKDFKNYCQISPYSYSVITDQCKLFMSTCFKLKLTAQIKIHLVFYDILGGSASVIQHIPIFLEIVRIVAINWIWKVLLAVGGDVAC